jgi:hypothetical protein
MDDTHLILLKLNHVADELQGLSCKNIGMMVPSIIGHNTWYVSGHSPVGKPAPNSRYGAVKTESNQLSLRQSYQYFTGISLGIF